jgi:CheY-like chemotaxis protein
MKPQKWILLAEDDTNDAGLTLHVLSNMPSPVPVVHVKDGAEALSCLYRRDAFSSRDTGAPSLVLLDLKMPGVDGFAVLRQVKGDAAMSAVPVAVFTSSREPSDLARSYELGTNAYVVKPVDFEAFTRTLQEIQDFWLNCNEPPPERIPAKTRIQAARPAPAPPPADNDQQAREEGHSHPVAGRQLH